MSPSMSTYFGYSNGPLLYLITGYPTRSARKNPDPTQPDPINAWVGLRPNFFDTTKKGLRLGRIFWPETRPNPNFIHQKSGLTWPNLNFIHKKSGLTRSDPTMWRVGLRPKNGAWWSGQAGYGLKKKVSGFLTRSDPINDQVYPFYPWSLMSFKYSIRNY